MKKNGQSNYSRTLMYKISCKDPLIKDIFVDYVTTNSELKNDLVNSLNKRKSVHKRESIEPNPIKAHFYPVHKAIKENGGFDNWLIEKIGGEMNFADKASAENERVRLFDELNQTPAAADVAESPRVVMIISDEDEIKEEAEPLEGDAGFTFVSSALSKAAKQINEQVNAKLAEQDKKIAELNKKVADQVEIIAQLREKVTRYAPKRTLPIFCDEPNPTQEPQIPPAPKSNRKKVPVKEREHEVIVLNIKKRV